MASKLRVVVIEARDLVSADANGLSDPYVRISMTGAGGSAAQRVKCTSVKHKTLQPQWSEELSFKHVPSSAVLEIAVLDQDLPLGVLGGAKRRGRGLAGMLAKAADDPLGNVTMTMEDILRRTGSAGGGDGDVWLKLEGVSTGEVHLQFIVETLSSNQLEAAAAQVTADSAATAAGGSGADDASAAAGGEGGGAAAQGAGAGAAAAAAAASSSNPLLPISVESPFFFPLFPDETVARVSLGAGATPIKKRVFTHVPDDPFVGDNHDSQFYRSVITVAGQPTRVVFFLDVAEPSAEVRSILVSINAVFQGPTGQKLKRVIEGVAQVLPKRHTFVRGRTGIPVTFTLPTNLPSTMTAPGRAFTVRYFVHFDVDVVGREDEEASAELLVVSPKHVMAPVGAAVPPPTSATDGAAAPPATATATGSGAAGLHQETRKTVTSMRKKGRDQGEVFFSVDLESTQLQPLGDIVADVKITSALNWTTIKALGVELEATVRSDGSTSKVTIFDEFLRLVPKLRGRQRGGAGSHTQRFVFELPSFLANSMTMGGDFSVSYRLSFKLDLPGSDLKLSFPITVFLPDPRVDDAHTTLTDVMELARLPRKMEDYGPADVATWLLHVAGKRQPALRNLLPNFHTHFVSGADLFSLFHEGNASGQTSGVAALTAGQDALRTDLWAALDVEVSPFVLLRRLLAENRLAHHYPKLRGVNINRAHLARLSHKDLCDRLALPLGDAFIIEDAAKQPLPPTAGVVPPTLASAPVLAAHALGSTDATSVTLAADAAHAQSASATAVGVDISSGTARFTGASPGGAPAASAGLIGSARAGPPPQ